MVVPFFRQSRLFQSLVLTTGVFSFLLWFYIVVRVVVNHVDPPTPFVNSVPSLSFSALGAFAFGLSFLSTFVYLWLWGRFGRNPMIPPSSSERGPWER